MVKAEVNCSADTTAQPFKYVISLRSRHDPGNPSCDRRSTGAPTLRAQGRAVSGGAGPRSPSLRTAPPCGVTPAGGGVGLLALMKAVLGKWGSAPASSVSVS